MDHNSTAKGFTIFNHVNLVFCQPVFPQKTRHVTADVMVPFFVLLNCSFLRKPRLNAELVAAQVAQVVPPKVKKAEKKDRDRKGDGRNLQKGR